MKRCPHCRSVVDDETECKLCGATLTFEPPVADYREKYAPGRYLLFYRLKQFWPAMLATAVILPLLFLSKPLSHVLTVLALLLLSWVTAAFQHRLARFMQWKYNPKFSPVRARLYTLYAAAASVFAAVLSYIFA